MALLVVGGKVALDRLRYFFKVCPSFLEDFACLHSRGKNLDWKPASLDALHKKLDVPAVLSQWLCYCVCL